MQAHKPRGRDAASDCEADGAKLRKAMNEHGEKIRLEKDTAMERPA
ncbi:hypothetical protein DBIPINDM_002707 [Mesorhizobium sp. AR02]|nr:hypothetical protein [Mesorhizobium sp. AR02]UVK56123.1 hypothetical protein DBIPINDM_002707 [Mesorhizobium sp. AR02]